jgi:hypothetical protein
MSRRSTPQRIVEAREAATRARLIGQGVTPDNVREQRHTIRELTEVLGGIIELGERAC